MTLRNARLVVTVGALVAAVPALAMTRTGREVVVGPQEVIHEDLYAAGREVRIDGRVEGDVVAVASTLRITGHVSGDVLGMTGNARLDGDVDGSARLLAGEVAVHGTVQQDLVAGTGRLSVVRDAQIGRDLLLGAGEASVAGRVGGGVRAAAGTLILGGAVAGPVRASVDTLHILSSAMLTGPVTYRSARNALVDRSAKVTVLERHAVAPRSAWHRWGVVAWIRGVIAFTALGLLLQLLSPRLTRASAAAVHERPWRTLAYGLVTVALVPLLAAIVVAVGALVGGWWIGLIAVGALAVGLALAWPVVGAFVGRWVLRRGTQPFAVRLATLALGVAVLLLAARIPVAGAVVAVVTLLLGVGALVCGAASLRQGAAA